MRCVIHIGTEKTGTTSVQNSLDKNRKNMLAKGFLYPYIFNNGNHPKIACYAMESENIDMRKRRYGLLSHDAVMKFRADFEAEFSKEMHKSPDTVLIVNEHLSRLRERSEVERLKGFLESYFDEVEIVIYLRRQDKMMRSMYSTVVKVGGVRSNVFPKWPQDKDGDFTTFDYRRILDLWSGVWGGSVVTPKVFDRDFLKDGDAVIDFLDFAKFKYLDKIKIVKANEGLSQEAIVMIREMNKNIPKDFRGGLGPISGSLFPGSGFKVSDDEAREFLSHFEESNLYVAREYFNRGELFSPIEDGDYQKELSDEDAEISKEDMLKMFSELWVEREKRHARAVKRLRSKR